MKKRILILLAVLATLTACSDYQKLLKSNDSEAKFAAVKNYYQQKNYSKAATLLSDLINVYYNSKKAEEVLYLMASTQMKLEDYSMASDYFNTYVRNYPRGEYAEESYFNIGYCLYLKSPETELDQTSTEEAIAAFTEFVEMFPESERSTEAYRYILELNDKLAYKGLRNARLYYNLGLYLGNNYRAAIVTAENTLKDFPETTYREQLLFVMLQAKYKEATLSVEEKKFDRYSEVIDEYYKYIVEFPNSKNAREATRILKEAKAYTKTK